MQCKDVTKKRKLEHIWGGVSEATQSEWIRKEALKALV